MVDTTKLATQELKEMKADMLNWDKEQPSKVSVIQFLETGFQFQGIKETLIPKFLIFSKDTIFRPLSNLG